MLIQNSESQLLNILLLNHPAILDAAVYQKASTLGTPSEATTFFLFYTAYSKIAEDALYQWLEGKIALNFVLVAKQINRLPLMPAHEMAEELNQLPCTDRGVISQWQSLIENTDGNCLQLVEEEYFDKFEPLHYEYEHISHPLTESKEKKNSPMEFKPAVIETAQQNRQTTSTLSNLITESVKRFPESQIFHIANNGSRLALAFHELYTQGLKVATLLKDNAILPKSPVILCMGQTSDFLVGLWGCILGGFVPTPLALPEHEDMESSATRKLLNACNTLHDPFILASRHDESKFKHIFASLNTEVIFIQESQDKSPGEPYEASPEDNALLLFTSGSTGNPKIVMLNNLSILAEVIGCSKFFSTSEKDVFFHWMPIEHGGSIAMMHLHALHNGAHQYYAPTTSIIKDPLRWLHWMSEYKITVSWAPNFAFNLVTTAISKENNKKLNWNLSSLRVLFNGGEAIVPRVTRRFITQLQPWGFPTNAMYAAWGMSETSSGCIFELFSLNETHDDDLFCCLGRPIDGLNIKIVDCEGMTASEGCPGSVYIKGENLTQGYYENDEANKESFTKDGWFITGDLGFIREGKLTITGRDKDVIIINGRNFYSHELEALTEDLPYIAPSFTAACAIKETASEGDKLAVFCVLKYDIDEEKAKSEIIATLQQKGGITPTWVIFMPEQAIPKTELGKIQRSKLATLHAETLIRHPEQKKLPNWFYKPTWHRDDCRGYQQTLAGKVVLIIATEQTEQAFLLTSVFAQAGAIPVLVQPHRQADNEQFSPPLVDDAAHLDNEVKIRQCITQLAASGKTPDLIVSTELFSSTMCHQLDTKELSSLFCASLLNFRSLIRAVVNQVPDARLLILTSFAESVIGSEYLHIARTGIQSMVSSALDENPALSAVCLDVEPEDAAFVGQALLHEATHFSSEYRVAWREKQRYVSRLSLVFEDNSQVKIPDFHHHGRYIITGGTGGVGLELADYLMTHYHASVALIGHKEATHLPETPHKKLLFNSEYIRYYHADVADEKLISQVLNSIEANWGESPNAIFHLAAVIEPSKVVEIDAEKTWLSTQAKVAGSVSLLRWLEKRKSIPLILFSSAYSWFGRAGWGIYGATNSALNALAHHYSGLGYNCKSLCWCAWEAIGMSRGLELIKGFTKQGFTIMPFPEAIVSLQLAMSLSAQSLMIGISPSGQVTRRMIKGRIRNVAQLVAYVVGENRCEVLSKQFCRVRVLDNDDRAVPCYFLPYKHVNGDPQLRTIQAQETIIGIWSSLLKISEPDIHSDFFTLGGDSLGWASLLNSLENAFDVNIEWGTALHHRTISQQIALVSGKTITRDKTDSLTYQNVRFFYRIVGELGKQPPLVILCGAFQNMYSLPVLEATMRDSQTLIFIDLPGIGIADDLPEGEGIEFMADCLHALQVELQQPSINLMGLSWGGVIAFTYAQAYPESVNRLSLISTTTTLSKKMLARFEFGRSLLNDNRRDDFIQLLVGIVTNQNDKLDIHNGRTAQALMFESMRGSDKRNFIPYYKPSHFLQTPRKYRSDIRYDGPVLLVTGQCDELATPNQVRTLARKMNNSTLTLIENCDHLLIIEEPYLVANAVTEFMTGYGVCD